METNAYLIQAKPFQLVNILLQIRLGSLRSCTCSKWQRPHMKQFKSYAYRKNSSKSRVNKLNQEWLKSARVGESAGSRCLTDSCRNVVVKITRGTSLIKVAPKFVYSGYEHADTRWSGTGTLSRYLRGHKNEFKPCLCQTLASVLTCLIC